VYPKLGTIRHYTKLIINTLYYYLEMYTFKTSILI